MIYQQQHFLWVCDHLIFGCYMNVLLWLLLWQKVDKHNMNFHWRNLFQLSDEVVEIGDEELFKWLQKHQPKGKASACSSSHNSTTSQTFLTNMKIFNHHFPKLTLFVACFFHCGCFGTRKLCLKVEKKEEILQPTASSNHSRTKKKGRKNRKQAKNIVYDREQKKKYVHCAL